MIASISGLVCKRTVTTGIAGRLIGNRVLSRGLGMGSPVSLLLWCVVFDPIIHGVQTATGNLALTYVDDTVSYTHLRAHETRRHL
eukprot:8567072-Prorocentrum_lima.AAC.1